MRAVTLEALHKKLDRYGKLPNIIQTLHFIETVEKITIYQDLSSIPVLLKQFRDSQRYYWVFENVKNAIEREYTANYVTTILVNIHILNKNAPEWACNFLLDILKTPNALKQLQEDLHLADPITILQILEAVDMRMNSHTNLVQELRLRLTPKTREESLHA